jgi:WD40 repeat protein
MQCDFYVSPLDWSRSNGIAFALSDEVIFINPKTMAASAVPDVPDNVLSLKFSPTDDTLFLGCDGGGCLVYDSVACEGIFEHTLFDASVLTADWKESIVIAGSREGELGIVDVRGELALTSNRVHQDAICAVKHCPDRPIFVTCGNDSVAKIWDLRMLDGARPLQSYTEHTAAIRAVAWSPVPGSGDVIVTGGGTADKQIKIWNSTTGETLKAVDTGSQVCNLYWNPDYNELLSSHGYSQNQLALWKATDLSPVASLHQHKQRVLYMCVSPDGSMVATAAPSDSFRIWKMFPPRPTALSRSLLLLR